MLTVRTRRTELPITRFVRFTHTDLHRPERKGKGLSASRWSSIGAPISSGSRVSVRVVAETALHYNALHLPRRLIWETS
jgi:hypothetical protein